MAAAASISLQQARQLLDISASLPSLTIPATTPLKLATPAEPQATPIPPHSAAAFSKRQKLTPKLAANLKSNKAVPKANVTPSAAKRKSLQEPVSTTSANTASKRPKSNPTPAATTAPEGASSSTAQLPDIESLNIDAEVEARLTAAQRKRKMKRERVKLRQSLGDGEKTDHLRMAEEANTERLPSTLGKRKRTRKSGGSGVTVPVEVIVDVDGTGTETREDKTNGNERAGETPAGESKKRRKTRRSGAGRATGLINDGSNGTIQSADADVPAANGEGKQTPTRDNTRRRRSKLST